MFSIIIPLYNKEKEIESTISSVIKAFKKYTCEIIIINDGSTDSSLDIINEIKKTYDNIIIINQKNSGVSAARNKGISISKFNYLVFIDGDDLLQPQAGDEYKKLIEHTQNEKNVGMYCIGYKYSNNKKFNCKKFLRKKTWFGLIENPLEIICQHRHSIFISASSICVNKNVITKYKINFPIGITHTEDSAFFYDLIIHSKICYSSKICVTYRLNASNRTNSTKPLHTRFIIDKIKNTLSTCNLTENNIFWSKSFIYKNYLHMCFNCIERNNKKKFKDNLKKALFGFNYLSLYYKTIVVGFHVIPFTILTRLTK